MAPATTDSPVIRTATLVNIVLGVATKLDANVRPNDRSLFGFAFGLAVAGRLPSVSAELLASVEPVIAKAYSIESIADGMDLDGFVAAVEEELRNAEEDPDAQGFRLLLKMLSQGA